MAFTLPPAITKLVTAWGANLADFTAAWEDQIAGKGYLPDEVQQKAEAILTAMGVVISDPAALAVAINKALEAGYDADHGGLA